MEGSTLQREFKGFQYTLYKLQITNILQVFRGKKLSACKCNFNVNLSPSTSILI